MDIDAPYAWTIAEANRLADKFAALGQSAPLAYASAVWGPNPCQDYAEFEYVRSHFRVLFECGATYCLEDDDSFDKPSTWFEGYVDFQTADDEHPCLLAQVVRIVGLESEFPLDAAVQFLCEAAVAFSQSSFAETWYVAGRAYGFQEQLGADISMQCHWWPFLTFVSELNQVPIRYIRRCCVTGFEPGGTLELRAEEEPFDWSVPDVAEAVVEKCDDDGIDYYAYVCHWPNVLRACELACRWLASKLTKLQFSQNLSGDLAGKENSDDRLPEVVVQAVVQTVTVDGTTPENSKESHSISDPALQLFNEWLTEWIRTKERPERLPFYRKRLAKLLSGKSRIWLGKMPANQNTMTRGLKHRNVAAELLEKLLKDEIKVRSRRNLVQSQLFSDKLKKTLNAYHNRAIATHEVIEELIKLAKEMEAASKRGEELGLNDDEIAFYDALATNESAIQAMGDDKLKVIAAELIKMVRKSVTIDWNLRDGARAKIRVIVKRILNKWGYPPDLQEEAVKTVLQQAELLCADWMGDDT